MTFKYLSIILIILGAQPDACVKQSDDIFTIYLVRHAEKDLSSDNHADPPLTSCGEDRAQSLSTFLSAIELDAVFSTNYQRTLQTAQPTATAQGLEIQEYSPNDLTKISKLLLANKQDALVVGHSNTAGVLAGLLVGEEIGAFDLNIYNRVYQVVIHHDQGRLHLLHTAFECVD